MNQAEIIRDAEQPLVSIVVPIYNVESFLKPALASIQAQTYDNLEVLLIDDGATDSSPMIAQEFALQNEHWTVYTKPNGGLSDARNYGLERAHGEYIYFMDSDDIINTTLIAKAVARAQATDSDVVLFDYQQIDDQGHVVPSDYGHGDVYQNKAPLKPAMVLKHIFVRDIIITAWSYLAKRTLFTNHDLRFSVGRLHEDVNTTPKVVYYANQVVLINEPLYQYRVRANSIMAKPNMKNFIDLVWLAHDLKLFFTDNPIEAPYEDSYYWIIFKNLTPYLLYLSPEFNREHGEIRQDWLDLLDEASHHIGHDKISKVLLFKIKLSKYLPAVAIINHFRKRKYFF